MKEKAAEVQPRRPKRGRLAGLQPFTEQRRSSPAACVDATASPIFLPKAPERNPRTECACQPVAFRSSFSEAPPERLSRLRTLAVLVPRRATVAFLGDLADVALVLAFFARLVARPGPDRGNVGPVCRDTRPSGGLWLTDRGTGPGVGGFF